MFNLFKFKNEADKIVEHIDKLNIKRQRVIDMKNVRNGEISNKIKKLEYDSWTLQTKTDTVINQIDNELEKLKRDLNSVKIYVTSVTPSEDKPVNVVGKKDI